MAGTFSDCGLVDLLRELILSTHGWKVGSFYKSSLSNLMHRYSSAYFMMLEGARLFCVQPFGPLSVTIHESTRLFVAKQYWHLEAIETASH